ncbi:MAG: hypothetical protein ACREE7_19925 [Dongiaceae bacterium]
MIISAIVFALLLGVFIFRLLPRAAVWQRQVAVGVFVLLVAVVYGGGIEMLGRPKPLRLEWRDPGDAKVLSAVPVENDAIYLWLSMPGVIEPRAYVLPWSLEQAQQLQQAMGEAEANGTGVQMTMPFEPGLDSPEPRFYAMPQPAMPAKDYQGAGTIIYQQPDSAS